MRYHIVLLAVFQTWSMVVSAQNAIGIPRVISHSKEAYRAGTQERSGTLYFANDEGLLTIDGHFWKRYPLPQPTFAGIGRRSPEHRNEYFRSFTVAGGWLNLKKCGQELWDARPRPRPVYP